LRHAAAWTQARQALLSQQAVALVTVAAVKGSAPREPGACMSVTADNIAGTIGGGTLEFKAIESARELLVEKTPWLHQQLGLGPALGQCCGGRVELIIETLTEKDLVWLEHCLEAKPVTQLKSTLTGNSRVKSITEHCSDAVQFGQIKANGLQLTQPIQPGHFHLVLFGAGHLGQALVPLLRTLPCHVHWVDTRAELLPKIATDNVHGEWLETPTLALHDAPKGSLALVMTHNHALDFEITTAALNNTNIAWVGMIGSQNKRRQLERHLARQAKTITSERLACPIGASHCELRDPAELAISFAASLLEARNRVGQQVTETQNHG